jgi:dipeptidyl aminopeptidase/acylaminoacyl peptidase
MSTERKPGAWASPISVEAVFGESLGLSAIHLDGDDVYWLESRASEGGRSVLVRKRDERIEDLTAPAFSPRTRANEYGGGAITLHDGWLYGCNDEDQALYRLRLDARDAKPERIVAGDPHRYADLVVDAQRQRLIAVRESHENAGQEPVNRLVAIDLRAPHAVRFLQQGADFYASPRPSPDGRQLAWICWRHPNLPWDGTELWIADFADDGSLANARRIAGGEQESIFQPEWSPGGELVFVSDRSGWWNLYAWRDGEAHALCPLQAEFGVPQWTFGASQYAFDAQGRIVCAYSSDGFFSLALIDPVTSEKRDIPTPYRDIGALRVGAAGVFFIGGSPSEPASIVRVDLCSGQTSVLRRSNPLVVDEGYLSAPQAITFPTTGGQIAHAFYYAPRNKDFHAPEGLAPPLLVLNHGGPTSAASPTFKASTQFWTSRGFAVVDVNYGGSSGYGRAYRERLKGRWGIVDVDDAVNAARHLVEQGLANADQLAIRGGSAGGYTALAALTFRDTFKAGASYYGIGDLEMLARDTHKFESRYLDSLVGPYPAMRSVYVERSPIHHVDRLSTPLILFQGLKDQVVPPNQAQAMFDAVKRKGLPVAYVAFADERHGFRAAATNQRALSAELYFYGRVFGFTPADAIEPVTIENLQ